MDRDLKNVGQLAVDGRDRSRRGALYDRQRLANRDLERVSERRCLVQGWASRVLAGDTRSLEHLFRLEQKGDQRIRGGRLLAERIDGQGRSSECGSSHASDRRWHGR